MKNFHDTATLRIKTLIFLYHELMIEAPEDESWCSVLLRFKLCL